MTPTARHSTSVSSGLIIKNPVETNGLLLLFLLVGFPFFCYSVMLLKAMVAAAFHVTSGGGGWKSFSFFFFFGLKWEMIKNNIETGLRVVSCN